MSFSESVQIQFCKHKTCRREPSGVCDNRRAVPVIGSVIDAETVGDADIRISIDVRRWLKPARKLQKSSTLTLVVEDAKKGDCYCPNVFPFNANTLIYLRRDNKGNIKLWKRSYIEQLDDDEDQSPYC
ncbi:uncharacterized protein LOC117102413 [Anneissia japonica]|uniref:uncharacterized protein LOC117102413 n=1 Tax=Anneissia japonica TaxID=1529436 RepID=UPI00142558C9|nr:uncharacterized protein LOC117102413 [Anneissia japonica]